MSSTDRLVDDYEALCLEPDPPLYAVSEEDSAKNRFSNVCPVAATRVRVRSQGQHNEYINANYVTPPNNRVYIATQAPLPETTACFWQMVFENDSRVIVMLCNLVERNRVRCHKYWPRQDEAKRFGSLTVKLVKSATLPGIHLRKLLVADGRGTERLVTNVQMTEWPDFGVPESSDHVRSVLDILDHYLQAGGGPPVVHCSAGLGRTGSFIAIHSCLTQLRLHGTCNVRETVRIMRQQRAGMIQTAEQYVFVYKALKDVLFSLSATNTALLDSSGESDAPSPDWIATELLSGRTLSNCMIGELLQQPQPASPFVGEAR